MVAGSRAASGGSLTNTANQWSPAATTARQGDTSHTSDSSSQQARIIPCFRPKKAASSAAKPALDIPNTKSVQGPMVNKVVPIFKRQAKGNPSAKKANLDDSFRKALGSGDVIESSQPFAANGSGGAPSRFAPSFTAKEASFRAPVITSMKTPEKRAGVVPFNKQPWTKSKAIPKSGNSTPLGSGVTLKTPERNPQQDTDDMQGTED